MSVHSTLHAGSSTRAVSRGSMLLNRRPTAARNGILTPPKAGTCTMHVERWLCEHNWRGVKASLRYELRAATQPTLGFVKSA